MSSWADYFAGNNALHNGNGPQYLTHVAPDGLDFDGLSAGGSFCKLRLADIISGIPAAGSGSFIIDYQATQGFLLFASAWQINLNTGLFAVMTPYADNWDASSYNLNDGSRHVLKVTADAGTLNVYKNDTLIHTTSSHSLGDPASVIDIGGSDFGGMMDGKIFNIYASVGGGLKTLTQLNEIVSDFPA